MAAADEELDVLREENTDMKREMQRLTEEMDRIQHRRHDKRNKTKQHKDAESKLDLVPHEVRFAMKQNEDLRRERLKLTSELNRNDTGRRISEEKNRLAELQRKLRSAKDELKALQTQKKARRSIVEQVEHTEQELRMFREQHRQELNGFKEEAHDLAEEQKHLDQQMIRMQVHIHRIQEKIKLGLNADAFAEMKKKVQHQDDEIATLSGKIGSVSADIDADTKRENRELKELRNDKTRLNERLEELKQALVERERELKLSYNLTKQGGASPRPNVRSA